MKNKNPALALILGTMAACLLGFLLVLGIELAVKTINPKVEARYRAECFSGNKIIFLSELVGFTPHGTYVKFRTPRGYVWSIGNCMIYQETK